MPRTRRTKSSGNWNANDAEVGAVTPGASTVTRLGCIAGGRTATMSHGLSLADIGGGLAAGFSLAAYASPAGQPQCCSL